MTFKQRKIAAVTVCLVGLLFFVRWLDDGMAWDHLGSGVLGIALLGLAWYVWAGREKVR